MEERGGIRCDFAGGGSRAKGRATAGPANGLGQDGDVNREAHELHYFRLRARRRHPSEVFQRVNYLSVHCQPEPAAVLRVLGSLPGSPPPHLPRCRCAGMLALLCHWDEASSAISTRCAKTVLLAPLGKPAERSLRQRTSRNTTTRSPKTPTTALMKLIPARPCQLWDRQRS